MDRDDSSQTEDGTAVDPFTISHRAMNYATAIRKKRDLLQHLFYSTRNSAAEAWALHRRLPAADSPTKPDPNFQLQPRNIIAEKAAAEAVAQDAAWAFVLIIDYSLRRLRTSIGADARYFGADAQNGVKLNEAIWAFANQARHMHDWETAECDRLSENSSAKVIIRLGHDPLNHNATREFVCLFPSPSYIDFEDCLLQCVRDIIGQFGFELEDVGPAHANVIFRGLGSSGGGNE